MSPSSLSRSLSLSLCLIYLDALSIYDNRPRDICSCALYLPLLIAISPPFEPGLSRTLSPSITDRDASQLRLHEPSYSSLLYPFFRLVQRPIPRVCLFMQISPTCHYLSRLTLRYRVLRPTYRHSHTPPVTRQFFPTAILEPLRSRRLVGLQFCHNLGVGNLCSVRRPRRKPCATRLLTYKSISKEAAY